MTMDRTLEDLANKAMADLAESGGGTYERSTLLPFRPTMGFAVGIGGIAWRAENLTAESLAWAIKHVAGEYETAYAGTWLNDGIVYIDGVEYFGSGEYDRAFKRAQDCGQKAFYDFGRKESITCD